MIKKNDFKDWSVIKLANVKKQIARIERLQRQDFLIFPEHIKLKFEAELALLRQEQAELIEKLNQK